MFGDLSRQHFQRQKVLAAAPARATAQGNIDVANINADLQRYLGDLSSRNIQFSGPDWQPWQSQGAQDFLNTGLGMLQGYSENASQGNNLLDQLGSFSDYLGEVGGPPTQFEPLGNRGVITPQMVNEMASLGFARENQEFGPEGGGRYGITGAGKAGITGQLSGLRAGPAADMFALDRGTQVATQLIPAKAEAERKAFETDLARRAQEQAGDLARRELTVGHVGNLLQALTNQDAYRNQYTGQWIGGLSNALAGVLQPQQFSYSGLGGEQGQAGLFQMGIHPNQESLAAGGYMPTG
jgi:hypothetical protein